MTPREKVRMHRKNERQHARSARYFLRHRDYERAIQALAWALRQEASADAHETAIRDSKKGST